MDSPLRLANPFGNHKPYFDQIYSMEDSADHLYHIVRNPTVREGTLTNVAVEWYEWKITQIKFYKLQSDIDTIFKKLSPTTPKDLTLRQANILVGEVRRIKNKIELLAQTKLETYLDFPRPSLQHYFETITESDRTESVLKEIRAPIESARAKFESTMRGYKNDQVVEFSRNELISQEVIFNEIVRNSQNLSENQRQRLLFNVTKRDLTQTTELNLRAFQSSLEMITNRFDSDESRELCTKESEVIINLGLDLIASKDERLADPENLDTLFTPTEEEKAKKT